MTLEELWQNNPQLALQIQATAETDVGGFGRRANQHHPVPVVVGGLGKVDPKAGHNVVAILQDLVARSPQGHRTEVLRAASLASTRLAELLSSQVASNNRRPPVVSSVRRTFDPNCINASRDDRAIAQLFNLAFVCAADGLPFRTADQLAEHEAVLRQRQHERKQQTKGAVSRAWFPTTQQWKSDFAHEAAKDSEAARPPSTSTNQQQVDARHPAATVVVNDAVSKCRICGEPFEIYWNDEAEEWHYRNAVEVKVIADGSSGTDARASTLIVHAGCSVIASDDGTVGAHQLLPSTPTAGHHL